MATEPNPRLTIAEYLALERASEIKHDYLEGEMFAMTGASRPHNRIVLNLGIDLDAQVQDRDCDVYVNEMRVRTPTDLFTYPDAVVSCWKARFDDSALDTLLTPVVIFEVLSHSTESYDRSTKLPHYQTIHSLAEIVLIAQDRVHVERWARQNGGWRLIEEIEDLRKTLDLPSIDCKLPLARIYRRVVFAED